MKKFCKILIAIAVIVIAFQSCEGDDNETKISSYNSDDSHKNGQDCMECHVSGGSGEGWFTIAGSVAVSISSISPRQINIKLYTEPNGSGDLIAKIEVDEKGNFYTTKKYDFGGGLYALIEGNSSTQYMIAPINHGRCNTCHGITNLIWYE